MASDISPACAQSRSARVLAALTLAALLGTAAAAPADDQQTYVWRDRDGTIRFSTIAPTVDTAATSEARSAPDNDLSCLPRVDQTTL
jgi:hypothetical protein